MSFLIASVLIFLWKVLLLRHICWVWQNLLGLLCLHQGSQRLDTHSHQKWTWILAPSFTHSCQWWLKMWAVMGMRTEASFIKRHKGKVRHEKWKRLSRVGGAPKRGKSHHISLPGAFYELMEEAWQSLRQLLTDSQLSRFSWANPMGSPYILYLLGPARDMIMNFSSTSCVCPPLSFDLLLTLIDDVHHLTSVTILKPCGCLSAFIMLNSPY